MICTHLKHKKTFFLVTTLLYCVSSIHGFTGCSVNSLNHGRWEQKRPNQSFIATASTIQDIVDASANTFLLSLVASSGLDQAEISSLVGAIEEAYHQAVGVEVPCDTTETRILQDPLTSTLYPGALGRVVLVHSNLDEDSIDEFQQILAVTMDPLVYSEDATLRQPVLISVQNEIPQTSKTSDTACQRLLIDVIQKEVEQYEMAKPLEGTPSTQHLKDASYVPSFRVELDGATTTDEYSSKIFWDTSSLLVFDNLVSDDLRRRLLQVTLGTTTNQDDEWDDNQNGPNPNRWIRGGLMDIPEDDTEAAENSDIEQKMTSCWGLTDEAIDDICFQQHEAIAEMEGMLVKLFPQFMVSRLPEAVFGDCVSPLTANAPTAGDQFQFHIDADPYMTPPSPWTDVYGRYPNRLQGKPRFMSCLVYLNEEWKEEWGGPTRFLDVPTGQCYEVVPRPGRCVLMDQDCSHMVVAPTFAAGQRPRYSLVWKLILHPKTSNQDMTDLSGDRKWPEPILFGSAAKQ
ncbi:2OG-Fe(II) oxygenase superfamily-domain containing protein [Nitzschia inconspicua]|uniref:2OG-Fe(II) oxygenase superfamily-domain containing protein n=1 Tax=Nitzschia inconspicua TaxID=303405 RepID=A0A9K3KEN3_9STRA|nr:2OG-Fe(II) oxygenase superfamily-domain containing protein [Nitzschia inconspicua]